jgi:hypothetical protein
VVLRAWAAPVALVLAVGLQAPVLGVAVLAVVVPVAQALTLRHRRVVLVERNLAAVVVALLGLAVVATAVRALAAAAVGVVVVVLLLPTVLVGLVPPRMVLLTRRHGGRRC